MTLLFLIFSLLVLGGFLLTGISLPRQGVRGRVRSAAEALLQKVPKKPETAKDYLARINGGRKENFLARTQREAREVYRQTGQQSGYARTQKLALGIGALGAGLGLLLRNPMLAVVLAIGCYFIPLWLTQFSLFRYNRYLNEELETALSLITTSYTRSNDILASVEENLRHIHEPVRGVFAVFCRNLKYVDANAPAQIERMKGALDNKIFGQWCDSLILCQEDHTLRDTLPPIVNKFSDQKAQQQENETKMMLPLQRALMMIGLTLGFIPLLRLASADWYGNLVNTFWGQLSLVATAIVVLMTLNKAIRLSKPIEYDV
ncbi:MAG: hypothetical protein AAGU02_01275 [Lawsonibacter sp.]